MSPEKHALLVALDAPAEEARTEAERRQTRALKKPVKGEAPPPEEPRAPTIVAVQPELRRAASLRGTSEEAVVDAALGVSEARAVAARAAAEQAAAAAVLADTAASAAEQAARELRATAGKATERFEQLRGEAATVREHGEAATGAAALLSEAVRQRLQTLAGKWPGSSPA